MSPQTQSQLDEVEQVAARLEAAFNERDLAALVGLYAEDAVLMPPSEGQVRGRLAIEAWFQQALPRLGAIRLRPGSTRVERGLAVQVGSFRMVPHDASASLPGTRERTGKYVLILIRIGEHWAICSDLWNLDQPEDTISR